MNIAKLRQALTDLSTWLTVIQEVNAERKNPSEAIKLACGSAVLAKGRCHAAITDKGGSTVQHPFKPDAAYWLLALNKDQLTYLASVTHGGTALHSMLLAGIEGLEAKEAE